MYSAAEEISWLVEAWSTPWEKMKDLGWDFPRKNGGFNGKTIGKP
jgi:hypothetical protein